MEDLDSLQNQAMDYILSSLDPHSTYIPLDEGAAMAERMQGGFSGIGVEFAIKKDTLVFVHVMQPAARSFYDLERLWSVQAQQPQES